MACLRITHDVHALMQCSIVGVMQSGTLAEVGAPAQLLEQACGLFSSMVGH